MSGTSWRRRLATPGGMNLAWPGCARRRETNRRPRWSPGPSALRRRIEGPGSAGRIPALPGPSLLDRRLRAAAVVGEGAVVEAHLRIAEQLQGEERLRGAAPGGAVGDDLPVRGDALAFVEAPQIVRALEDH